MKNENRSHLRVRLDPERIARLEWAAKANGRTLTGEITSRLDASLETDQHEEVIRQVGREVCMQILTELRRPR